MLREVAHLYPQIVRILVTAYADKDMLLQTVNSGEVFRILEKPLSVAQVREVLRLAGERHRERALRQHRLMAIDETLAFLAHELNTPLAAIANFARGIESRVAGEYTEQRQGEIGQAASAMHDNAQYCLAVLSSFDEGCDLVLYYKHLMVLNGDSEYSLHFNETDVLTDAQRNYAEQQYALFRTWYASWSAEQNIA